MFVVADLVHVSSVRQQIPLAIQKRPDGGLYDCRMFAHTDLTLLSQCMFVTAPARAGCREGRCRRESATWKTKADVHCALVYQRDRRTPRSRLGSVSQHGFGRMDMGASRYGFGDQCSADWR